MRATRAKASPHWNALNEKFGGILDDDVRIIRGKYPIITKMEARLIAPDKLGYDPTDAAIFFGVSVETIYNHHSHIRTKLGVDSKVPFHAIFNPPPHQKEEAK